MASAPPTAAKEYAIEVAAATVRYGFGVTREVGMDAQNMGCSHVALFTDPNISKLDPVRIARESLEQAGVKYTLYDQVRVEPSDTSVQHAVDFARRHNFDAYVAVGGGSTIDTAKIANLMSADRTGEVLDYVNAPIGKGKPITVKLKPLIAIPTTSGTGSETTGTAVFDYKRLKAKVGISNRGIRPTLGLIDPANVMTMPRNVKLYSGFDVLCHALESYTAIPFQERPRPANPLVRPLYQGSNQISDVWSLEGLRIVAQYLKRSVDHPDDVVAHAQMHLAASMAGIGFGNAGCHLCHGLSYPISSQNRSFAAKGYADHALIPHGLSVMITAPAVFEFTGPACPDRHLLAASILGADITKAKRADAGRVLGDALRKFMASVNVEDGLTGLGYTSADLPALVEGAIPQERVTKLSPRAVGREELGAILERSLKVY